MVQIEAIPMANEALVFPQIGDPNCFIAECEIEGEGDPLMRFPCI